MRTKALSRLSWAARVGLLRLKAFHDTHHPIQAAGAWRIGLKFEDGIKLELSKV